MHLNFYWIYKGNWLLKMNIISDVHLRVILSGPYFMTTEHTWHYSSRIFSVVLQKCKSITLRFHDSWLLFWRNFHRAQMIQNWVQMKGTDANVSCTKFEWIWKTWVFIWYLASRFGFMIAWLLFWRNFHRAQMIQNWVQMKGTDANVSCTKFERIWKTWVFKRFLASRFAFMIVWLLILTNFSSSPNDPKLDSNERYWCKCKLVWVDLDLTFETKIF